MESEHPLVFGGEPVELDGAEAPRLRPRLDVVTRKVLATLEPLEPAARARVLRAAAILLELDDALPWMR